MEVYDEYCVKAQATSSEKAIGLLLVLLAISGMIGCFFFWPLLLVGILAICAAVWYIPRLEYEYEYLLSGQDLTMDKVIAKKARKSLAEAPFKDLELFTTDKSLLPAGIPIIDYTGIPGQGETGYFVIRTQSRPLIYAITCNETMIKDMRRMYPQKTRLSLRK